MMLDPRERSVLLETLRPPDGYRMDSVVGTTFSLDLLALLTVAALSWRALAMLQINGWDPLKASSFVLFVVLLMPVVCRVGGGRGIAFHKLRYSASYPLSVSAE